MVVMAGLALIVTASVSLILPLAVRRVIDGFNAADVTLLDSYFGAALGIAGVLALGTGVALLSSSPVWASGWWPTSAAHCLTG